jgi:hypothetical protein
VDIGCGTHTTLSVNSKDTTSTPEQHFHQALAVFCTALPLFQDSCERQAPLAFLGLPRKAVCDQLHNLLVLQLAYS